MKVLEGRGEYCQVMLPALCSSTTWEPLVTRAVLGVWGRSQLTEKCGLLLDHSPRPTEGTGSPMCVAGEPSVLHLSLLLTWASSGEGRARPATVLPSLPRRTDGGLSEGYLRSFSECGSIVVSSHPQHILSAVVEFRKAVEFAVLEVNQGLVDPVEGSLRLICFVHERLETLSTQVKVSHSPQVHGLSILLDFIFNV